MKTCSKCSKVRSITDFPRSKSKASGVISYCKLCMREYQAAYRDRTKASALEWRIANANRLQDLRRTWARENRDKRSAANAQRYAAKLQAAPHWAKKDEIDDFYITASGLSMLLGEWHEVDHIVPLQGKTVCGLHVECNLRVITAHENQSKSNRYWPDMP